MISRIWPILSIRLFLPVIGFGSNLVLLRYFGVDRFAVLATLLQGALLSSVLLKFGRDDSLLYNGVSAHSGASGVFVGSLMSLVVLVALIWMPPAQMGLMQFATALLQVVLLGFLSANLAIAAMTLQVHGRLWFGNLCLALAGPLSAWVGPTVLSFWWQPRPETDSSWFAASLAGGFVLAYIATSLVIYRVNSDSPIDSLAHSATTKLTRNLWILQIIDVLLLSGDLILLGLLDRRGGLELYITASRLAVASAFITLALEQALATLQRAGRKTDLPSWLLPSGMIAIIPIYVVFLSMLGIEVGREYDLAVLVILMLGAAAQSHFLKNKVQWAGAGRLGSSSRSMLPVLFVCLLACAGLCWFGLQFQLPGAWRAASFVVLAILTRCVLAHRMGTGESCPA